MNIAETVNVYWAFRAVIRCVRAYNAAHPDAPIRSVLCPGLGTGEGRMSYGRCAWQMYNAYAACVLGRSETLGGLAGAVRNHMSLLEQEEVR